MSYLLSLYLSFIIQRAGQMFIELWEQSVPINFIVNRVSVVSRDADVAGIGDLIRATWNA